MKNHHGSCASLDTQQVIPSSTSRDHQGVLIIISAFIHHFHGHSVWLGLKNCDYDRLLDDRLLIAVTKTSHEYKCQSVGSTFQVRKIALPGRLLMITIDNRKKSSWLKFFATKFKALTHACFAYPRRVRDCPSHGRLNCYSG